ncbi:hypothetical protein PCC8801_3667 [Rippkaea orientalis PCC 8801]|uniref:Isopropylmalate/homocitrate/citramalate synthases n=1 Tax=Rippkaea orientalis (strain PCC 8801 / RF-1) TaxID=41431 RepID=B7K2S8_RIPO1|nr:hypothetical protein [Rippkaea orientalis]ACK67629.1 hypothetical protein PCC8801_3667 [Rippkaea orientalis PCC 8801]
MDYSSLKNNFFYPRYPYYGDSTTENLSFNGNLQNFAQKISYICNLATAGKLSNSKAYQQIESLWKELSATHNVLIALDDSESQHNS